MAKGLRERVGKQYTGTQRTRNAVHGECTVELAKWTFPIISRSREPYEAKVSRTGLTGGMGRRTVRQRALCLPTMVIHKKRASSYGCAVKRYGGMSQDLEVYRSPLSRWV